MAADMTGLSDKTREDLEWRRLEEAVATRCAGPLGARLSLVPASTPDLARLALEGTAEALRLLTEGEPLPLSGIRELDAHLKRLERQGALDGPALRDVQVTLGAARALRRFLAARRA